MSQKLKIIPNTLEIELAGIPPTPSVEHLPKWYKDMPGIKQLGPGLQDDLTIKKCIPILDALTMGYYLVTKEEYSFSYDKELKESKFIGPAKIMNEEPISRHPITQINTVSLSPEYIEEAFKWKNSWLIKTPPGYSCLFTHPLDGIEAPFKTLDGVVDTDNFFMPVLFPFLMKNSFEGVIPAGTPVVQIIPFKRQEWKSVADKYDLYDPSMLNALTLVEDNYKKNTWESKKYE